MTTTILALTALLPLFGDEDHWPGWRGPDGAAVEAVHPGAKRCMGFVSRKSSFKLGGGKSSKKEKK